MPQVYLLDGVRADMLFPSALGLPPPPPHLLLLLQQLSLSLTFSLVPRLLLLRWFVLVLLYCPPSSLGALPSTFLAGASPCTEFLFVYPEAT